MARVTHAAPHQPIAEVKHRMRTDQSAMARQRWPSHDPLKRLLGTVACPKQPFMR